jgi:hypothetical protein
MNESGETVGYCFECRHPLMAGESHRCPECGGWYDADDPRTSYRRRPGSMACLMMRPSRWPSILFGTAIGLLCIVAHSIPDGYFLLAALAMVSIIISLFALLGDGLVSAIVSRRMGRNWAYQVCPDGVSRLRRDQIRWFIAPAIVLFAMCLVVLEIPQRFTFWISKPAMLEILQTRDEDARWAGLIPISSVDFHDDEDSSTVSGMIWIDGAAFFGRNGFALLPGRTEDRIEPNQVNEGVNGWRYDEDWFFLESHF